MPTGVHRTTRTSLFAASRALVAIAVGLVGFRSSRCFADAHCSVRLSTDTVDAAWVEAARDAERRLGHAGPCGILELRVAGASASLTLLTADGRRAVRELAEASELAPTVEAMLVAFDPDISSTRHSLSNAVAIEVPRNEAPRDDATHAPESPSRPTNSVVLGGVAGVRAGGNLATPVVGAFGAITSGAWELGVAGQWEMSYGSLDGQAARPWGASGFAGSVAIGRRENVSSLLDLRAGVTLAGAMLHQETHHQHPEQWLTRADARLGAYAGVLLPRRGIVRFRAEAAIDFVPITGQTLSASPDLPPLPTWGASLMLGAETNGP